MATIKPSRNELIDMIITKIYTKFSEQRTQITRQIQKISQSRAKLSDERSQRQASIGKTQEVVDAAVEAANTILVAGGFEPISATVDSRCVMSGSNKIRPMVSFSMTKGKPQIPRSTKVLDRKIAELKNQEHDLQQQRRAVDKQCQAYDLTAYYNKSAVTQLRSRIVQQLFNKDEELLDKVNKAAVMLVDENLEIPEELLQY